MYFNYRIIVVLNTSHVYFVYNNYQPFLKVCGIDAIFLLQHNFNKFWEKLYFFNLLILIIVSETNCLQLWQQWRASLKRRWQIPTLRTSSVNRDRSRRRWSARKTPSTPRTKVSLDRKLAGRVGGSENCPVTSGEEKTTLDSKVIATSLCSFSTTQTTPRYSLRWIKFQNTVVRKDDERSKFKELSRLKCAKSIRIVGIDDVT